MMAVNYTNLRDNLKTYMDKIVDDYEVLTVTRKENKNIIMLSEESYNNLLENIYITGSQANYEWLLKGKAQIESGLCADHNLIEVEDA